MNNITQANILQFKKGGIHINKENRGKFIEYCDGKVTQECINKAKKSGNKKLIKRAVFAENSRKWKHQKGGLVLKFQNPATSIKKLDNIPWMSREDFLKAKADEERQIAYLHSLNRTMPDVPLIPVEYSEESFNNNKNYWILYYTKKLASNIDSDDRAIYARNLKKYLASKYNPYGPGASCAYTATGNYSQNGVNRRCSGNLIFASNPKKYGFIPTTKENLLPGDLVQNSGQSHMMMFDSINESGNMLYNYSNGGDDEQAIVKKGKYPMYDDGYYYTFVGTDDDLWRWTREWLNKYVPIKTSPLGIPLINKYNLNLPLTITPLNI